MLYTSVGDNMRNKKLYKKDRRGIIVSLLIFSFVLMLSVGYSALNEELTISGEAHFRAQSEIRITDVRLYETAYNGQERYQSKYSKDSITLGVDLKEVKSSVTYLIEVTNYGTVAMMVDNIGESSNSNDNSAIELIDYNKSDLIMPGETKQIYIKIKYKTSVSSLPVVTAVDLILGFEYVTPESTLAMGSSGRNSAVTFYNSGPIKKNEVESIEFLPTLEVGEDAIGYWDASYKKDGTVIAWYTDTDSDNLYELYIGGNGKVYAYANAANQFSGFTSLESIKFGEYFDTSNVVSMGGGPITGGMFGNCISLKELDLSNFDTRNVTSMNSMFGYWYANNNLEKITFGNNFITTNVTDMSNMFFGCAKLKTIDVTNFDTRNVKTMAGMFRGCTSLTELDLTKFDTSNVIYFNNQQTYTAGMFESCSSLTTLDLSNFNTEKAVNMQQMFYGCRKLQSLDISNFNTSNVTNMGSMFFNCRLLTTLDLSHFNTSKVTTFFTASNVSANQKGMFGNCAALTTLNLSSFDTTNITNMKWMFNGCKSLVNLDIRGFDFTNVTDNTDMFSSVPAASNIIVNTDLERNYILGVRNDFTNIKTIEELPGA